MRPQEVSNFVHRDSWKRRKEASLWHLHSNCQQRQIWGKKFDFKISLTQERPNLIDVIQFLEEPWWGNPILEYMASLLKANKKPVNKYTVTY